MKLGDLWIKLGLKKDEFSKGLKEAGEEVSGNGGLLGKLKALKGGAAAIWAAVAAGAVAMADKFAHTSQRLGDQWDQVTAGLKASWNTFIAAINSTDFSGIGKRLADSFREARQLASMKDAEFEVMNSIALQKSAARDELAVLRVRMQNQKLSQKEREAAAQEYLSKVKKFYDQEADYRKKYSLQAQNTYLTGAGLRESKRNREALQTFLTNVAPDGNTVQALDEFKRNGYRYANESQKALLQGLQEQTGVNVATLSKIATYYQSTNDEQAKALVDAIVAERAAAGAFNEETRRVQTLQNSAAAVRSGSGGNKVAERLERDLARAKERIDGSIEDMMEDIDKEFDKDLRDIDKIEFEPLEIVPPDMTAWDEWYDKYSTDLQRMQDLLKDFRESAIDGFTAGLQELADQIAGVSEINPGAIISSLLTPLADMAIKEGQIVMATGFGIEAVKKGLESLTGAPAITAGAALIMIGAAAKAGLSALASNGAAGTTTSTYNGTGGGSGGFQTIQTELTIHVDGKLSGSNIVLAGQRTVTEWGR